MRRPSATCRVLSEIHSSFTASLLRGRMRTTSRPRVSTRMAEPTASITSMLSVLRSSHGRVANAHGRCVSAPTGHRSTALADSSDIMPRSR